MSDPVKGFEDEVEPHMRLTLSNRGFKHMPAIDVAYGGRVSVYESSAADGPHYWLNVVTKKSPGLPHSETIQSTAHVAIDQLRQLAEQIDFMLAHHYQVEYTDVDSGKDASVIERPMFRVNITTWQGKLPPVFVLANTGEEAIMVLKVIFGDRAKDIMGTTVEGPLDIVGKL